MVNNKIKQIQEDYHIIVKLKNRIERDVKHQWKWFMCLHPVYQDGSYEGSIAHLPKKK